MVGLVIVRDSSAETWQPTANGTRLSRSRTAGQLVRPVFEKGQTMKTGFRNTPTESGFASRSAAYLASQGYPPRHIRRALVEHLDLAPVAAAEIVDDLAA